MKIVVLSDRLPATTSSGGCPRLASLISALGSQHQYYLIVPEPSLDDSAKKELVDSIFDGFFFLPKEQPRRSFPRRVLHSLLLTPGHLKTIRNPQYVSECRDLVARYVREVGADHIHIHGVFAEQYLPEAIDEQLRVSLDLVDSLSLFYERQARLAGSLREKLSMFLEAFSSRCYERALAKRNLQLITISEVDKQHIERHIGRDLGIQVVPNGIDMQYFQPDTKSADRQSSSNEHKMVFTGVMNYPPNTDAAIFFAREVFPIVRTRYPDASFSIVGMNPPAEVRELANIDGVEVTGMVPDIRPYLADSAVFVSPLRFGAGMKNKVLAAMAAGVPVVATSLSVEGINVIDEQEVLLADSPKGLAAAVSRVFDDMYFRQSMEAAGLSLVQDQYSWQNSAERLGRVLQVVDTAAGQ